MVEGQLHLSVAAAILANLIGPMLERSTAIPFPPLKSRPGKDEEDEVEAVAAVRMAMDACAES